MKYLRITLFMLTVVLLLSASPTFLLAESSSQTGDEPISPEIAAAWNDTSIPPMEGGAPYPFPIVAYEGPTAPINTPDATDAPVINVWYGLNQTFGQMGTPQQWINILGTVTGATSLTYSLNGGAQQPLNIGSDGTRLYGPGDFNIELDYTTLNAMPQTNTVSIVASDGATTDVEIVTVNYHAGVVAPLPFSADWSLLPSVQAAGQPVDGKWLISAGTVGLASPGYDRLLALGDMSWKDYEVTVPVTVHSLNTADLDNSAGVGLIARWQGHFKTGNEQPAGGWRKLGTLTWFRWNKNQVGGWEMRGNGGSYLRESPEKPLEFGTTYIFKLSVQSSTLQGEPATYRFKVWPQGQPEPAQWFMQSIGSLNEPETGSILLVAHQAMVSFGKVDVRNISNVKAEITIQQPQHGEIIVEPDKETYSYGETVTIRALGDSGYRLQNWTGNFSGSQNPIVFDITKNVTVGAAFIPGDPLTLTVDVIGQGTVDVQPKKSQYLYGELVTLTPRPANGYLFAGWSGGHTGSDNPATIVMGETKVITASFIEANPDSPVSDDFNACALNTGLWTFVNPVGDGTYEMTGTQLRLNVPAGISHNIWLGGNRSVRVMQPTQDIDFEIVTKFESSVNERYQMQGMLVEQDASNFLRFETHHDGTSVRVYAAKFINGNPTAVITTVTLPSTPGYQRVTRVGSQWSFSYSNDGQTWASAGSFDHSLTVNKTGVFAANHGGVGNEPAHTAIVDYFFNSASPIVPEDGNVLDGFSVTVNKVGQGNVTLTPAKDSYTCGEKVTLTATPANGWSFLGWSGDVSGTSPTVELTIARNHNVTATFVQGNAYRIFMPVSIDR